jgi:hypothetical protein
MGVIRFQKLAVLEAERNHRARQVGDAEQIALLETTIRVLVADHKKKMSQAIDYAGYLNRLLNLNEQILRANGLPVASITDTSFPLDAA